MVIGALLFAPLAILGIWSWWRQRHLWETILERAGLGKLRVHCLRHTFASHAAMNKETLPTIGRLLGHAQR
jgi:integrase